MNLILFSHPGFSSSQSMPRFASMLEGEFKSRGNTVQVWSPQPHASRWLGGRFAKWSGYFDQYVLFPLWVTRALRRQASGTLYVFLDQALGPWVPLVRNLPHVVAFAD